MLDPINKEDVALIGFNSLGQPESCKEPAIDLDEWELQRIEFSIIRYGLDDPELCDQRKAVWASIQALFSEYENFGLKAKREQCKESAGRALQIRGELARLLNPKSEFTAVVRDCFQDSKIGRALYRQLLTDVMAA